MPPVEQWQNTIVNFFITYGFQMVGAVIILIAGGLIARWLAGLTDRTLIKHHLEPPIRVLMVRVVRLIVFGFAVVLALDKFGVPITPMVAGIGVAGVGIGLAAQGVLGNIFAGLTIIFTKPFRVGEYIELLHVSGEVTNIELFSTTLLHGDRSRVVIPNRKIVGEILHNYGATRQLSLSVGIAYNANVTQALSIVREILSANPRVLKDPKPVVGIEALADSAITIGILPWVAVPDYGPAQLEIYQAIIDQFRTRGIEIPFPQREVRLLGKATA
ncbi:MAG TPA: mechanosensitive ion channel family protein [Verrucomicrobiae bacterium]|nr:mechanosensitive ion channel family protein [Verrucomicrobiae bacterium]